METDKKNPFTNLMNNNAFLIGGIIAVIIIAVVSFMMVRGNKQVNKVQTQQLQPTEEVIPTVDSSVKVEITAQPDNRKFDLTVSGIPRGTTSLEYEISYETDEGGIQGFNSPVDIEADQDTYEKKGFLLGTCSTGGKCSYHTVAGPLKVTIKFTGSYGEKLFEDEFEL